MDIQQRHEHAAWHGHASYTGKRSMDMDMEHEHNHRQGAYTCPCCMSMSILHVHFHAACPCPRCMSMSMLNVYVRSAGTWTCSTDLNMQHGHLHISMDMDMSMQHGHGRAAFPFYSLRLIFVSLYLLQIIFVSLLFASYHIRFTCQIFKFASKRIEANLTLYFAISRIFIRLQIRYIRFEVNMRGHPSQSKQFLSKLTSLARK